MCQTNKNSTDLHATFSRQYEALNSFVEKETSNPKTLTPSSVQALSLLHFCVLQNQSLRNYGRPKGDSEVRVASVDKRAKQDR